MTSAEDFMGMMMEAAQAALETLEAKPNPTPLEERLIDDLYLIPGIEGDGP